MNHEYKQKEKKNFEIKNKLVILTQYLKLFLNKII